MRYKTLYYNVEPIAKRLPDDCLKLIIQYASEKSKYENWFQTMLKNIEITNQKTREFHNVVVRIKMNDTKYIIRTIEYRSTSRWCHIFHSHKIVIYEYCLLHRYCSYVYILKTGQYCDFYTKLNQLIVLGQLIQNRYISLNKLKKLKKLNKLNK